MCRQRSSCPGKSAAAPLRGRYRNVNNPKDPADQFGRFFRFADGKSINNAAGFRPKSKKGEMTEITKCAFCLLVTTFGKVEWPDHLDREQGIFTYYGDNRRPGRSLHDTPVGGNQLLQHVFSLLHTGKRNEIPPFLCFEKYIGDEGTFMRFLGLAVPGADKFSSLQDLVAVWRVKDNNRFQNYRAVFTILRQESISHAWLEDLVSNMVSTDSKHCPTLWSDWVRKGTYDALTCERQERPRTKAEQLSHSEEEWSVLETVRTGLTDREFEFLTAELVRIMDDRFTSLEVTPAVRDHGRDVVGRYRVGHDTHHVSLDVYVEAKHWKCDQSVGVRPMSRLLSRIKHRDLGVFVTTSFFDIQVQNELIEDRHPVLLIAGGDIARLLIRAELGTSEGEVRLSGWLDKIRSRAGLQQDKAVAAAGATGAGK